MTMLRRLWPYAGLLIWLPILFFVLFYFYPLATIFRASFFPEGQLQLGALRDIITTPYYWNILWFTFWQALLSTILVLVLAFPGAYIFARYRFRGKETIRTISTLPFVLPTVVVANAFLALIGARGILNSFLVNVFNLDRAPINLQFTIWAILLAHIFFNYSVALRIISGAWQNMGQELGQAAQMLGASPARVFWSVTLPLLRPSVMAAGILIFIFCFTSFGVVLILGGPRYATLEVEIYRQAVNLFNLPVAAALSIFQILFTFVFLWLYTGHQAQTSRPLQLKSASTVEKPVRTLRDRLLVYGNLLFMLLLLGLPLAALLLRSLEGAEGLTLRFYQELFVNRQGSLFFVPPAEAILNSTAFALATVLLATLLGLISAWTLAGRQGAPIGGKGVVRRLQTAVTPLLDPMFMLPLATSAVTLGFGFILALNRPPLNLRRSLLLVPIAHTLVAMPFVIRSVLPAMRRINPSLREAAAMLGADSQNVLRHIDWPLIRRALLVGAVFAFTISMGEFGATIFLARPQTPTMPVAIYRFLGQPGALNYGQAMAMSCLLLLVCALGFVIIERFRIGDEGEF